MIPPILINTSRNHVSVLKGITHKFNFCEFWRNRGLRNDEGSRGNPQRVNLGSEISKYVLKEIESVKFEENSLSLKVTGQNYNYLQDLVQQFKEIERNPAADLGNDTENESEKGKMFLMTMVKMIMMTDLLESMRRKNMKK